MDEKGGNQGIVEMAQQTLEANKAHLDALKTYTQRLEAELAKLDKLLDAVNTIDESDLDVGSSVTIPGSVRAITPITAKELLSNESPFHEDALKRNRYRSFTEVHPMKPKELEVLAEAVQAESYRKRALDIQKRGCQAFPDIDTLTPRALGLDAKGIDWNRIAEKVSAISITPRTARECEIRWLGEQHPEFNHEPWSKEEVQNVKSIAAEFTDSRPDWVAVAKRLGTRRTPLDCMRHATSRNLHHWTAEADERLLKAIYMYGHDNWYLVARYVSEDATPSQCSSRFEKTLDDAIKHTAWSPEEDVRLFAAVAAFGSSWVDVAANIPGRHNDQCRDRWNEYVNPNINKSEWLEEEDRLLLGHVREHENASWREISERLGNGRTEAMCRGRYAVLQKGANTVPAASVANYEVQVTPADQTLMQSDSVSLSSNTLKFKSFSPNVQPSSTTPDTESQQPNEIIFLEPVVSSNPEVHEYHRAPSSQSATRFQLTTGEDTQSSNTLSSKKRKIQSRTKPRKPMKKTQRNETAS